MVIVENALSVSVPIVARAVEEDKSPVAVLEAVDLTTVSGSKVTADADADVSIPPLTWVVAATIPIWFRSEIFIFVTWSMGIRNIANLIRKMLPNWQNVFCYY